MHHRSWFPVILAGSSLVLIFAFFTAAKNEAGEPVFTKKETPKAEAVSEDGYKTAVTNIVTTFRTDNDAAAAYDALILLRVPAPHQAMHFDLVVAMGKLMSRQAEEGEARLQALKAQYSWLPL